MIDKILGAATIGSTLASAGILRRFLADIASIMMLAVIGAFMLCTLVAGGFVLIYSLLLHYGLEPLAAGLTLGALIAVLSVLLLTLAVLRIKRLREPSFNHGHGCKAGLFDIGLIAEAFIDGFLNPKK